MRPYGIALEKGDSEMVEYFKGLEHPADFIVFLTNLRTEAKRKRATTKAMIDLLQSSDLHFELPV